MYMNPDILYYFQQLNAQLYSQSQKMDEMNKIIRQLQQEIKQLKENNNPPVVKNEYKFDLLKVERLEGTLNIGLNPNGSDSAVGEFDVGQSMNVPPSKEHQDICQKVQKKMNQYLNQDACKVLEWLEKKYGYPLEESYRNFIINDVRQQLDKRIQYYVSQISLEQIQEGQWPQVELSICNKVQKDIENTFEAFIRNLPGKETKA
jgi:spore germination protein PC